MQKANKATFAKLTEAARPKKAVKSEAKEASPRLVPDGDETGEPEPAKDSTSTHGHEVIDVDES